MNQISFAQVNYKFDLKLQYDYKNDTTVIRNTYYINSQNNLAFLQTHPIKTTDSLHLILRDFRGQLSNYTIKKRAFKPVETIKEEFVSPFYPSKAVEKNYVFKQKTDTILDGKTLKHMVLKSTRSKKYQKRKQILEKHYLIDQSIKTFPLFDRFMEIKLWKKQFKKYPLGIAYVIFYKDFEGKNIGRYTLKKIEPIKLKFTTPANYIE
ncbi:hypothetical protein [Flavobacteriaceae bacterium 14752]|uniref:hypothetical protein n=1 Tax=Mesohalobacter salilacus TaxID=2491711 RepID=UPI000F639C04|nr:hypothetical protein EIG84_05060 [Flavobacteriaceae bacterium 14752]